MLVVAIFLLLGCSQISAFAFDNNTTDIGIDTAVGEARVFDGGVALSSPLDWIVSIHDVSGASPYVFKGPGVAYSAHWVITTDSVITGATVTDLAVFVGVSDAAAPSGRKHRVKSSAPHVPARTNILHNIVLLNVCPPLTTFAPMATAAGTSFAFGTPAKYVNFATTKKERTARKVGATCQCAHYTNYDANFHFCLDEEDTNYIVTANDPKASVCIIDSKFAGFNVEQQNLGGEPYLDIFQYTAWLSNTATPP